MNEFEGLSVHLPWSAIWWDGGVGGEMHLKCIGMLFSLFLKHDLLLQ